MGRRAAVLMPAEPLGGLPFPVLRRLIVHVARALDAALDLGVRLPRRETVRLGGYRIDYRLEPGDRVLTLLSAARAEPGA